MGINRITLKYILMLFLLFTFGLCQADTIDVWCISHYDNCLIQANQNSFDEGKEIIYFNNEDRKNEYEVNYTRDVGYETKRKLHFYYNGIGFYVIQYANESNRRPVKFKLGDVLDNLSTVDSGMVIKIYYSEQNEHFSEEEIYIGKLIASENIYEQPEKNYNDWLIVGTMIIVSTIGLIVLIRKSKRK